MNTLVVKAISETLETWQHYKHNNGTSRVEIYFDSCSETAFVLKKTWYCQPESVEKAYFTKATSILELIKEEGIK